MKPNPLSFNAVADPTGRVKGIGIMAGGLIGLFGYVFWTDTSWMNPLVLISILICLAFGLADIFLMPQKYILNTKTITIERRFWKTTIDLSVVIKVELRTKEKIPKRFPIFPMGWRSFQGAYGKFLVGKEVWNFHAHRHERFVLLHTYSAGVIAISPEPAMRFTSQAQDMLKMRVLGRAS